MNQITVLLAKELGMKNSNVQNVIDMLDDDLTIPFIARYRKESHDSTDDTKLRKLEERLKYLRNLETRKAEILKAIDSQDKLDTKLSADIERAVTLSALEDLYRPYKVKRRTRATIAKERGLEPLANYILTQEHSISEIEHYASDFIDIENKVETIEDALAGASDIIAEQISDSALVRRKISALIQTEGVINSVCTTNEDSVYSTYYDFSQSVSKIQNHQILALNRGEKEGVLKVSLRLDESKAYNSIEREIIHKNSKCRDFLAKTVEDSYSRLLFPSMERTIRSEMTEKASEGAIDNFAVNLHSLLMQPPVKGHVTMGLDPGYRHGCKVAVIDATGRVLDTAVVYPTFGEKQKREAINELSVLIKKFSVEHIAIGNGTASRETELMATEMIKEINKNISYMMINEAGASVYSASKLAADEFPEYDVNLRSAISIARRMQDPLAELVKIEPKAIGVGQYQHDMPQKKLTESLKNVVEDCVNSVGVDLNTASPSLLSYVSGLSASTARNIAKYRDENGKFTSRKQILKVSKLGPKAFEQSAGFLRVPESSLILDNTGVHPESYDAAAKVLEKCGYSLNDVADKSISNLSSKMKLLGEENVAKACEIGIPTLKDIINELLKPGRDPRDDLMKPILRTDIMDIDDLKNGMKMKGTVRNVIDFGVFVDIGVHQDGLVHISEIADKYIKHPSEILSVGDIVDVIVLSIDKKKGRISLSIKQA